MYIIKLLETNEPASDLQSLGKLLYQENFFYIIYILYVNMAQVSYYTVVLVWVPKF